MAQAAVQHHAPDDTVVAPLLQGLYEIMSDHGTSVASTLLSFVPLALAKGKSADVLRQHMADYWTEDDAGNFHVSLQRTRKSFTCDVIDTGMLTPGGIALSSTRRT
jgi:hypothetical protein